MSARHRQLLRAVAGAISAAAVEPVIVDRCVKSASFSLTPAVAAAVTAYAAAIAEGIAPELRTPERVANTISFVLRELARDGFERWADDVEDGVGGARRAFVFYGGDHDNAVLREALAADLSWSAVPFVAPADDGDDDHAGE